MRVFITGGSGFIGGHLVEALAAQHEVLAMARSERSASIVEGYGATAVRCSLGDVSAHHLEGVDIVVHAAASVDEFGPRSMYERLNVEGTARMLDAARQAGAQRFIQISSNATVFDGAGQQAVDEDTAYTELSFFHYGQTKAAAEKLVLEANGDEFTTLALRPCFVWGPRDAGVLPALLRMVEDGGFVWIGGGRARVSTTHVFNLVHAVQCAMTEGQGGQAYFVADAEDTTLHGFLSDLAGSAGVALPERSVPAGLVRGLAWASEWTWTTFALKGIPPITRMAAWLMSSEMTVRSDRARRDLGWTPPLSRQEGVAQLTQ